MNISSVHSVMLSHVGDHNGNTGTYLIMESGDKIVGRRDRRTWEYGEWWGPFQVGHRSQESRAVA